ncbi:MAG: hypothetical protein ACLVHV_05685 [Oscillospiraceae bacterium]
MTQKRRDGGAAGNGTGTTSNNRLTRMNYSIRRKKLTAEKKASIIMETEAEWWADPEERVGRRFEGNGAVLHHQLDPVRNMTSWSRLSHGEW